MSNYGPPPGGHYYAQPAKPASTFLGMSGGILMLAVAAAILLCVVGPIIVCAIGAASAPDPFVTTPPTVSTVAPTT